MGLKIVYLCKHCRRVWTPRRKGNFIQRFVSWLRKKKIPPQYRPWCRHCNTLTVRAPMMMIKHPAFKGKDLFKYLTDVVGNRRVGFDLMDEFRDPFEEELFFGDMAW